MAGRGRAPWTVVAALVGVGLLGAPAQATCDAKAVVEHAVKTHGTAEGPLMVAASLTLHRADGGLTTQKLLEYYALPGRARYEYKRPGSVAVVATDGKQTWKATKSGPVPADPGHFTVPLRIRDPGTLAQAGLAGGRLECLPGAREGAQRVLMTLKSGEMVQLDVDTAKGLVVRYTGESPGTGAADTVVVTLDEWKNIEGRWVAFKMESRVNGRLMAENAVGHVTVGVPVPDAFFKAPYGILGPPGKEL